MHKKDSHGQTALRDIPSMRPLYLLPNDPFVEEVLIPNFSAASAVDSMMGFFSSEVLASLAPGLATFINRSEGRFRLIISPMLRSEDIVAIRESMTSAESVVHDYLDNLVMTEDLVQQHTLKCLAWLIRIQRIEIKIALMREALFHPKVWLFHGTDQEVTSAHGSSNLTQAGLHKNIEQVAVSVSWSSPEQRYTTEKLHNQFLQMWANRDDNCIVVELPVAIKQKLLTTYTSERPPTETELRLLYQRAGPQFGDFSYSFPEGGRHDDRFTIPSGLRYEDIPFAHQGQAVQAWCDAGYSGVLEMATGSGKTITAMICAHRLYQAQQPLLIVVSAPYIPLIQQWCEEIKAFGISPINLSLAAGARGRAEALGKLRRQFQRGATDVAALVVTQQTLSTPAFQTELELFTCAKLLIADEAHNLGSEGFMANPPEFFDYRLGLSATPVRQYDETGTEALFRFLGPVVFRFGLEEAIGKCLVEYDYYVHPVELTMEEMDRWSSLTARIKQNAWRLDGDDPSDFIAKLLRDRRAILENAANKIDVLAECLNREDLRSLRHTLVYTSDKAPAQLESVNALVKQLGLLFHQLTYEETASLDETRRILRTFQEGTLRVITAKRVLDEGINIPQIQKAYILASTTVERQWIQRRGRLLRRCEDIGKTHSVIHDFVALPPEADDIDDDARSLIRSELLRVQEFARLARNAGKVDGPLLVVDRLIAAAYY